MSKIIIFTIGIALSAITVFADYFVKRAAQPVTIWNKWLLIGAIIYGLTAIGWAYTLKFVKLSTLGVIYGVSSVIFVVIVGLLAFHEKLSLLEIVGILLGVASLIFLYRFY